MARRREGSPLHELVERQSSELRSLATSLTDFCESSILLTPGTRAVIRSWAAAIAALADELTTALNKDGATRGVKRANSLTRGLLAALAVTATGALGALGKGVVEELDLPARLTDIAGEILERSSLIDEEIESEAASAAPSTSAADVVGNLEAALGRVFVDAGWPNSTLRYTLTVEELDDDQGFVTLTLALDDGRTFPVGIAGADEVTMRTVAEALNQMGDRMRDQPGWEGMVNLTPRSDREFLIGG